MDEVSRFIDVMINVMAEIQLAQPETWNDLEDTFLVRCLRQPIFGVTISTETNRAVTFSMQPTSNQTPSFWPIFLA